MTKSNQSLRLAINGFGRIGRMLIRCYLAHPERYHGIEFVAINDIAPATTLVHLLNYDSTHGRLPDGSVMLHDEQLKLSYADKHIATIELYHEPDPARLPWATLGIDIVLECTGLFRSYTQANHHRHAGAHQVIIGAAPFDTVDASIVMGVNELLLNRNLPIISGVSCTTQALVPLLHILDTHYGIESVMMTEIHAVTADQMVLDHSHRDLRRARASGHNIIPTTSSSINATERVLPNLMGKLSGYSIRVPTINVACIDVSVCLVDDINLSTLKQFLKAQSELNPLIMGYTELPLVSSDFIGDERSLIIDGTLTMQAGKLFKIVAWYDNEVGYATRLLQMCVHLSTI